MKMFGLLALAIFIGAGSVYAQDKSLEAVMQELGDSPYYVKKSNCNEGNCNHIPYEYETEWFWLSKSEKLQRRVRNIERRNEWLKNSGKFKTQSEADVTRIAKERAALEAELLKRAKEQEKLESTVATNDAKLKKIEEEKKAIQIKKDALMAEARKLFESSDAATAGDTTFGEDVSGIFGGNNPKHSKDDKKKIDELEKTRKELRRIMGELDGLNKDAVKLETATLGAKSELTGLTSSIENGSAELQRKSDEYGRAVERIKGEKARAIASVNDQTLAYKKEGAEKYAEQKLKELKEKGNLAEFILNDLDSIKKDLKLGDLEAKLLVSKINNTIEKSLLGKYIQEQMQKTLNAAMDGSCQMAKLCAQHDSINNDTRKRMEPVLDAITKEYLAPSTSK